MAKVKINDAEFNEIENNIVKAMETLQETMELWGTHFDNLYYNFVESGFLDDLYNDAISNYHVWSSGLSAVSNVATGAVLGCAIGSVIPGIGNVAGAIIGAVIGAIFGVCKFCTSEPTFITTSRDVLKEMLNNCRYGVDDSYIYMENMMTKLVNSQVALERVKTYINEFNQYGANFEESAKQYDLSLRTGGSDNLTILGVETEVVIDGQTITMDTSEAMSAFYTYAYTVTSSRIAADYLQRTYGYDIDFLGLVTNANAFMADTIQSDLYGPEMVYKLLPQCTPNEQQMYEGATVATGLKLEELQAALGDVAAIGVNPLFAGLVGATMIGKIGDGNTSTKCSKCGNDPCTCGGTTTSKCSKCGNDPCTCGGTTTSKCSKCGNNPCTCGGNTSNVCSKCGNNPCTCGGGVTTGNCSVCGQNPCICGNKIEISTPVEPDVPIDQDIKVELGVLDPEGNVDYDKLAMEEYQFETGIEEIEKYRLQIMDDIEAKYASGDFTSITKQLQEYGYGTAEIATILASKSMTINAILDGNTRQIVANKAAEMAKADGVENYKSSYSNNPSMNELKDNTKPLKSLHLNSDNKELVEMENELDALEADYRTKVDDANKLLDEAGVDKQAVDQIKEKYEKEFGSDTSKWSEDAAKEYDAAIDKYNTSAEAANKAIEEANTAKETYQTNRKEFDKACEDYYLSKIIEEEETGPVTPEVEPGVPGPGSVNVTDPSAGSSEGGATINPDGSVSFDDNGSNSGTNDGGVVINPDGTVSFDGSGTNAGADTSSTSNTSGNNTASDDAFLAALGIKTNGSNN